MQRGSRKRGWLACAVLLVVAVAVVLLRRQSDILEVPLGVEHAVAVTCAGPELKVKPFEYGVAVSLRIANVQEQDGRRTYDIRYMLNRGGEFNIIDYLATADGTPMENIPAFRVRGMEVLSVGVDKRIQELQPVRIDIWHYYYETMAAVVGLWVLWLGLIVFWPRPHVASGAEAGPSIDPFPAMLRRYLEQIGDGSLSNEQKARLEMMLIDHWRAALPVAGLKAHAAIRQIATDARCGDAYRSLSDWLHNPSSEVTGDALLERLRPFARDDDADGGAAS